MKKQVRLMRLIFVTISNNTKEEQANWCGQEGIDMLMLHDLENTFGETYQIMIPEFGTFCPRDFCLRWKRGDPLRRDRA